MWFWIVISECCTSFVVAVVGSDGDCVVAFHNCNFRVTQQGLGGVCAQHWKDSKGTFEDFGWQIPKGYFHFHPSGYVSMDVLILSLSKFEASGFLQFFFLTTIVVWSKCASFLQTRSFLLLQIWFWVALSVNHKIECSTALSLFTTMV